MIRNLAGQSIGSQMTLAATGADFTGTVTVYITLDAGTQTIGSVGAGVCTAEGNGLYTYLPTAAETNGAVAMFTFVGVGAITRTVTVETITQAQAAALASATGSLAVTWADICRSALRRINAVGVGATPTPDDLADAFALLQDLVSSWKTERLIIPYIKRTTWTLTSAKGTIGNPYTVGSGGDVDVSLPARVVDLIFKYQDTSVSPTMEYQLVQLTDNEWRATPQKTLTGTLPARCYYQPTFVAGFGSLYLMPVPSQSNLQGILYAPATIDRPVTVNDAVIVPDAYLRFMKTNLAIECAPVWRAGLPLDQELVRQARESKANVKGANIRPNEMAMDTALGSLGRQISGGYDINSDT